VSDLKSMIVASARAEQAIRAAKGKLRRELSKTVVAVVDLAGWLQRHFPGMTFEEARRLAWQAADEYCGGSRYRRKLRRKSAPRADLARSLPGAA
jgi:hypothetical protein